MPTKGSPKGVRFPLRGRPRHPRVTLSPAFRAVVRNSMINGYTVPQLAAIAHFHHPEDFSKYLHAKAMPFTPSCKERWLRIADTFRVPKTKVFVPVVDEKPKTPDVVEDNSHTEVA